LFPFFFELTLNCLSSWFQTIYLHKEMIGKTKPSSTRSF